MSNLETGQENHGQGVRTAAIVTRDLAKTFQARRGAVEAVRSISLDVEPGSIVGLLGPNGAGKTTTLRMLTTLLPIGRGSAHVAGFDVDREPHQVRTHIGYVSQLGGSDEVLTARENLRLQARLYGIAPIQAALRAQSLINQLELSTYADRAVKTYSGGQRRRLDIALGIIHQPEVLFLDEPSTGLDPQSRANLWEHIRSLGAAGMTIVVTTHYLDEADALCDDVYIIDQGKIVAHGAPGVLKQQIGGTAIVLEWDTPPQASQACALLQSAPFVREAALNETLLRLYVDNGSKALSALLHLLEQAGLAARSLRLSQPSLDDVFLRTTGRSLREETVEVH